MYLVNGFFFFFFFRNINRLQRSCLDGTPVSFIPAILRHATPLPGKEKKRTGNIYVLERLHDEFYVYKKIK